MGCCPTHDGIKAAGEALREALRLPSLSAETRSWLERRLIENTEREAIVVEGPDGIFHSGICG